MPRVSASALQTLELVDKTSTVEAIRRVRLAEATAASAESLDSPHEAIVLADKVMTTAPPRPYSRRGRIPRRAARDRNGHSTALVAAECQSFLVTGTSLRKYLLQQRNLGSGLLSS
jgi:hypothetical protein